MRTAEYMLTADHEYLVDLKDRRVIPKNSHVSPVWNEKYLPKHLDQRNLDKDVWCFTKFGFVKIPRDIIRKCY